MTALLEAPQVKPLDGGPPIDFDRLLVESLQALKGRPDTVTEYVAGFLIDRAQGRVALVVKNRPAWQYGRWNGIGGKVETGETPADAMRREFREETGYDCETWDLFCSLKGDGFVVHFFREFDTQVASKVRTMTDEIIQVVAFETVNVHNSIPNLPWLIQMALCIDADRAGMFEVKEVV